MNPAEPKDGGPPGEGDRTNCPPASEVEACAARGDVGPIRAHLDGCRRCSELFAEMRANAQFMKNVLSTARAGLRAGPGPAPDAVPGYRISGEIHRGGQGVVYRAVQLATGRDVAIKMLLGGVLATERQRLRFQIESELAARLRHPNIVSIHDRIALPMGGYALVMEYVEGAPLNEWRPSGATAVVRARAAVELFAVLCDAVHSAHQSGVIHRDLKPSNVIIDKSGNPRVLDFGLAKAVDSQDRRVTMTGDVAWTIAYASPEQVADPHRVDVRADVYSLGVMLYEVLAGRPPYETQNCSLPVAMERVRDSSPEPLRQSADGAGVCRVDHDLETIVGKSLEKDAARRYQSCAALGDDLRAWLAGDRVAARAPSFAYLAAKFVRRHRVPVVASAFALGALLIGGALIVSATASARAADQNAREQAAASEGARLILSQLVPATDPVFRADAESPARRSLDLFTLRLDIGELAERPEVEAAARSLLADLYEAHSLMPMGIEQRRRVVELRKSSDGGSGLATLDAQLRLARSLAKADRELVPLRSAPPEWLNKARLLVREQWGNEALRVARAVLDSGGDTGRVKLGALEVLGAVAAARNDGELGREVEGQLRALPVAPGTTEEAVVHETLARLALLRNDTAGAARYAEAALRTRLRIHVDEEPEVAQSLALRATVGDLAPNDPITRLRQGSGTELSLLDQTERISDLVDVKRELLGLGTESTSLTSSMLRGALLHIRYGEWDSALTQLEACKVRLDASEDRTPAGPRVCLDLLVDAAIRQGDLEIAERWSTERVADYQRTAETANPKYGRALMDHADIAARSGRLELAVDRYHEARKVLALQLDQPSQELLFDMIDVRGAALDLLHHVQWGCPGAADLSPAAMNTSEYGLVHAVFKIVGEHKRPEQPDLAFARPLFLEWGLYRAFGELAMKEARLQGMNDVADELQQLLTPPPRADAVR